MKILDIVKKNINVSGLAMDLVEEALEPALQKIVADSSNKLDDMLMAAIFPLLKVEMKKLIEEQVAKL